METAVTITRAELADALAKWERDAPANGWDQRTDDGRHFDTADWIIHTVRLARGEGDPTKKED